MLDQQNNLSTSNSKEKKHYLIKYVLWFFIPVIAFCCLLELLTLNIPANYKNNSAYFNKNKNKIELIALGSSQMDGAINPEYIDIPSICLASSSQHHNLDFTILKQVHNSTNNLKYVVLELSNSHLELPHNSKSFWKNSVYLKYFKINAFQRKTYFKDELIYFSNPDLYSKLIKDYYINNKRLELNKFGFDTNNFSGIYPKNNFDENLISNIIETPNQKENREVFEYNSAYFFSILDYIKQQKLQAIICTLPLYKNYSKNLNTNIINRRDSIISIIKNKYPSTIIIEKENDSINYEISDFNNGNHFNTDGAKKFSLYLNSVINNQEHK